MAKDRVSRIERDWAKRKGKKYLHRPQVKETNREEETGGVAERGPDEGGNELVGWFNIA